MGAFRIARPQVRDATREVWAARFGRFAATELTVADFCRREHVSVPAFYYWKRRLGGDVPAPATAPRLLPVRLAASATPVELVLPGGLVLRLAPGCDLDLVRALAAALGGPPC
jgi:hypothetical protein